MSTRNRLLITDQCRLPTLRADPLEGLLDPVWELENHLKFLVECKSSRELLLLLRHKTRQDLGLSIHEQRFYHIITQRTTRQRFPQGELTGLTPNLHVIRFQPLVLAFRTGTRIIHRITPIRQVKTNLKIRFKHQRSVKGLARLRFKTTH